MSDHMIKNFSALATTQLRTDGLTILEAGYKSILTKDVVRSQVQREGDILSLKDHKIDLTNFSRVFFVAIGKCAVSASEVIEPLLIDRLTSGIVLDVCVGNFSKLKCCVGTHPFPSEANVVATESIQNLLKDLTNKDLVILVVSGGGSALLCSPLELKAEDLANVNKYFFEQGATIEELNTVRKHLSTIQGGQLAKQMYPATVYSLVFSDVPGNDLSFVASGPTVLDRTTKAEALAIIDKYGGYELSGLKESSLGETPKEEKYFEKVKNILFLTNEQALQTMRKKALELGYSCSIQDSAIQTEATSLGQTLSKLSIPNNSCWLYGGETTVTVRGNGQGGRCQELVLSALPHLVEDYLLIAASSDGWDNTPVAGAIGDRELFEKAKNEGWGVEEYLTRNDSYSFFQKCGGFIDTGRTGANVSDFYLLLKK